MKTLTSKIEELIKARMTEGGTNYLSADYERSRLESYIEDKLDEIAERIVEAFYEKTKNR